MKLTTKLRTTLATLGLGLATACGGVEPGAAGSTDDLEETRSGSAIGGNCRYTVTGTVKVRHQVPALEQAYGVSPLAGIDVKVSGKAKVGLVWGWYDSWGQVRTDANGRFTLAVDKGCGAHRVKVAVEFEDSEVEIHHATSTLTGINQLKWYQIYEMTSGEWRDGGTRDIGIRTFEAGAGDDLDDDEPRGHADIWVLYHDAIDWVNALGTVRDFTGKVVVKFPHDSWVVGEAEESYANPITNHIYIEADDLDADTLLHELMHVWAYQHSTGEDGLAVELLQHGDTHGLVDESFVAFHEGFAEYAKDELKLALYGFETGLPYSREQLGEGIGGTPLRTLARLQRHDLGWRSVFRTLTLEDLGHYDFLEPYAGAVTSPWAVRRDVVRFCGGIPGLDFADVLLAFESNASRGYPADLDTSEMTIEAFLDRLAGIDGEMDASDADAFLELLDPSSSARPEEAFTCDAIFRGL